MQYSVFIVILVIILAGCSRGFFSSGIDSRRDADGNVVLLDTPNNWDNWMLYMDLHIANELAGKTAPGGLESWEEFWNQRIALIADGHQDNHQKYINYIIERRRQAGLPPLEK